MTTLLKNFGATWFFSKSSCALRIARCEESSCASEKEKDGDTDPSMESWVEISGGGSPLRPPRLPPFGAPPRMKGSVP